MRCALVGFLLLLPVTTLTAQDAKYAITLKEDAKGDKIRVTTNDESKVKVAFSLMGQMFNQDVVKSLTQAYTEEILEAPPKKGEKPLKMRRDYGKVEQVKEGKRKVLPYSSMTVLIEKKGDKFRFTVDGEEYTGADAEPLEEEFNKKDDIPLSNEDFLPGKPIAIGEEWTVKIDKIVESFSKGGPFKLDPKTTTVTGKMTKVMEKNGHKFGIIELDMNLGVNELDLDGQDVKAKAGSRVKGKTILEVAIDGSSHTGSEKTTIDFDIVAEIPNGTMKFTGTAKLTRSVEDLGK